MPGSGPIDPEIVVDAIKLSTTSWSSNHLVLDGGLNRWPVVAGGGTRWSLSASPACLIDQDTFNALRSCTLRGSIVVVAGASFQLDAVTIAGASWATLQPA